MTTSLIKYETVFEATNNLPMIIAICHGENADLVASFKDGGIDVDLTGYTARAIYQPKSKWGTDDWYECPCEIVNDTVIAHWGNTYDNGDDAVKLFMHLVKDGKVSYPAIYQIRLFASPGFSPSAIEPIPETIDFAQYQLENAPWALQSDFNTLSGNVSTLSSQVNTVASNIPYKVVQATGMATPLENRTINAYATNSDFSLTLPGPIVSPDRYTQYIIDLIVDVKNQNQSTSPEATITFTPILGKNQYGEDEFEFAVDKGESFEDLMKIEGGEMARYYFTQTGIVHNGLFLIHVSKKVIEAVN